MTSRKRRQRTKQPDKVRRGFSFLLWFGLTSKNLDMIPRCFLKVLILLILFPPNRFRRGLQAIQVPKAYI